MPKILIDNTLNLIIDMEVESLSYKGETYNVGDTVECTVSKSRYIIKYFEMKVSRWDGELVSPTIMVVGEEMATDIDHVKLI